MTGTARLVPAPATDNHREESSGPGAAPASPTAVRGTDSFSGAGTFPLRPHCARLWIHASSTVLL